MIVGQGGNPTIRISRLFCIRAVSKYVYDQIYMIMRIRYIVLLVIGGILSLSGCRTKTVYIPQETVRTEYQDRYLRDSIYLRDSVYVRDRGDSIFVDRWHTQYIDRLRVDSFLRTDTIREPYPVEKIVYVNKTAWYQDVLIWIGLGALAVLIGWLIKRRF